MNPAILSHKNRLDTLFTKVSAITSPQDQSEWAKYLCVLTAGFIEESLRVLLTNYTQNNSSMKIQRFMGGQISFITNCKTERITEILNKFDVAWETSFLTAIASNSPVSTEIKDSLDGIVINRHKIAHGKSIGIGYTTVKNYYQYCVKAVEILETVIV